MIETGFRERELGVPVLGRIWGTKPHALSRDRHSIFTVRNVTADSHRRNQSNENYARILSRDQPGIFEIRDSSALLRGVASVRCSCVRQRLAVDLAGRSTERRIDQMSCDHNSAPSRFNSTVQEKILGARL